MVARMVHVLALATLSTTYSSWGATLAAPCLKVANGDVVALAAICASGRCAGNRPSPVGLGRRGEVRRCSGQELGRSKDGRAGVGGGRDLRNGSGRTGCGVNPGSRQRWKAKLLTPRCGISGAASWKLRHPPCSGRRRGARQSASSLLCVCVCVCSVVDRVCTCLPGNAGRDGRNPMFRWARCSASFQPVTSRLGQRQTCRLDPI